MPRAPVPINREINRLLSKHNLMEFYVNSRYNNLYRILYWELEYIVRKSYE